MRVAEAPPAAVPVLRRPPGWLIGATGLLAVIILILAVAETNLRAHYLIDGGEFISVFGLAFILLAGLFLYTRQRLAASMPLVLPWLLYPVITQGDQIIDNLSINSMRVICHVLLGAIFATPVAVIVLGARSALAPRPDRPERQGAWLSYVPGLRPMAAGRTRQGIGLLSVALLTAEMWLADQYLGTLMIVTLIGMIIAMLLYASSEGEGRVLPLHSERAALATLVVGVAVSMTAYVGYKNAPGAYQGSPSFLMDPARKAAEYPMDRVAVPSGALRLPASPVIAHDALTALGQTFERLLAGYHILDRNYTYDFHNELFMRHTPLLPNYRESGLARVADARVQWTAAEQRAVTARTTLAPDDPLAALLDDVRGYAAFCFARAPVLESMSGEFAQTPAGLQHAAHLYEGESKYLGTGLMQIVTKHSATVDAPALAVVTGDFARVSRSIHEAYAHHVVGF
jgi:hypothetical protein